MIELRLERVWSAPLKDVSLSSSGGVSVIVGAESDGTGELVELCAGVRAPRRGRVLVAGEPPSASPRARRGIASLLANEELPPVGDVRRWLHELSTLVGFAPPAVLERCSVGPERDVSSLSSAERRELACCVALAHPQPTLVALHEPLTACDPARREWMTSRITALGAACTVVVTCASIADARRLGGSVYLLDRGLLDAKPAGSWPGSLAPGLDVWLAVEADAPRGLLAALADHPDVLELRYDETRGGRILLRGPDLERLATAVARAALTTGADIRLLRAAAEDLDAARAAATGMNEASGAAYRAARARRVSPPEARSAAVHAPATSATPAANTEPPDPPA